MKYKLGAFLRAIRMERSATIKDVAEKAGISSSLLSQIERNRISPSLDTLLQILEVYGVSPEHFFKTYEINSKVEIIKGHERKLIVRKGCKYQKLSGESQDRGNHSFNAFFLELDPGARRGDPVNGHLGRELGIVTAGQADLVYGDQTHTLAAGDSVSFFSEIPHVLINKEDTKFQAYWVVTPADGENYFG